MSYKNSNTNRDFKKLLSAIILLIIALMFFLSMVTDGFTIPKLIFGCMSAYFCIAFFRNSRQ